VIYGSVCSGIEAATVAWHPLGWRAAFLSEIEAFPRAVLAHHYPDVPLHGDFTTIQAGDYAAIDVLVGGTPCQSFSVAGLRGGMADDRGNLALEYLRLADRLRPRWLVWENVPGVLSSAGGRDFGSFLGGLGELGYGWAYRVLDAQYFGLAQRRKRVFVVGCAGDWRRAAAVLFERHSLSGHPAPRRQARERVAGTLAAGAHPGGHNGQDDDGKFLVAHALRAEGFDASEDGTGRGTPLVPVAVDSYNQLITGSVATTLTATGGGPLSGPSVMQPVAFHPTQEPINSTDVCHALGTGSAGGCATAAIAFSAKGYGGDAAEELSPTLRSGGHDGSHANGGVMPAVEFDLAQITSAANRTRAEPGLPAPTVLKASRMHVAFDITGSAPTVRTGARETDVHVALRARAPGASEGSTTTVVAQTMAVRRLTPVECLRLQGFPDNYLDITYRGKPAADGPKYKAIGNSMAVPCMAWIGQRIAAVDALVLDSLIDSSRATQQPCGSAAGSGTRSFPGETPEDRL
jgi:DNA (cytosine-5)-methyltransferase 1